MSPDPARPWKNFLDELDSLLDERFELHCIGGFAVVAAYGFPRSTNDLDYCWVDPLRVDPLQRIAGPGSALARKHKVHLHHTAVGSIGSMPEDYDKRLMELFPGRFKNLRLFVPDPYDLILSKLSRNVERDREDTDYLAKSLHLDPTMLRQRYKKELRANLIGPLDRHDATLKLWLEAYFRKSEN